ncbi:MAG: hypothetical protein K6A78_01645 [Prevotella sp.]|jgi:hypothetical protein|nr:hypothetical protein [Prevotella sp.]
MNTITLQIENQSILPSLKKVLGALEGVTLLPARKSAAKKNALNSTTIKAIKAVKAGKTFKASSADDLISQCLN